jgi:hypothetical protein
MHICRGSWIIFLSHFKNLSIHHAGTAYPMKLKVVCAHDEDSRHVALFRDGVRRGGDTNSF